MMVTFVGGPLHAALIDVPTLPVGDTDPDRVGHLHGCALPPIHSLESCRGDLPLKHLDVVTAEWYTGVIVRHVEWGKPGTLMEGQPVRAWTMPVYLHAGTPPGRLNQLLPGALAHRAFTEWGSVAPLEPSDAADAAVHRGDSNG